MNLKTILFAVTFGIAMGSTTISFAENASTKEVCGAWAQQILQINAMTGKLSAKFSTKNEPVINVDQICPTSIECIDAFTSMKWRLNFMTNEVNISMITLFNDALSRYLMYCKL